MSKARPKTRPKSPRYRFYDPVANTRMGAGVLPPLPIVRCAEQMAGKVLTLATAAKRFGEAAAHCDGRVTVKTVAECVMVNRKPADAEYPESCWRAIRFESAD